MTDLYDRHIDEMRAREIADLVWDGIMWGIQCYQDDAQDERNRHRLMAYKRKRAGLQRLGQEYDNG